jgi:predicted metal-dependent hydrolase
MRRRQQPQAPSLPGFEPEAQPDPAPPDPAPPDVAAPGFRVEVTRSARRKRSVGAVLVGDVLRITIPSWMSRAEEARWIGTMSARYQRKMSADRIELTDRAATLSRRYDLPRPREIKWADDMTARWGSCTPGSSTIRISNRLARFPDWVIDYVIVHELAHLEVAAHSPEFWRLVHRYPKAERATGYLIAKSGDVEMD